MYDVTDDELRASDTRRRPVQRWIAIEGGSIRGAVVARLRPDDRLLRSFVGARASCVEALSDAVVKHMGRGVHTFVPEADSEVAGAFSDADYHVESILEGFRLPIARALRVLSNWPVPAGFEVVSAADVDLDRLFTLDNTIRQDVPGCDGRRGDRELFRREFEDTPQYEPDASLVAIDLATDEYAGLIRIWRNATGPRVGLVGVARQYRNTQIVASLLRQALTAAATWRRDWFLAEASPSNRVVHPRLERLLSTGRQLQLVRRPESASAHPG